MGRRRRQLPDEAFEAEIEGLDDAGCGRALGVERTTLVYNALPGETVSYRLRKRARGIDLALAEQVLKASPDRVEPGCRFYPVCSGCALQHLDHDAQIAFKQRRLLRTLDEQVGAAPEQLLAPLLGPQWGYRRKARLGVRYVRNKERVLVGFRERGRSWLADMQRCEVLHPSIGARLGDLADMLTTLDARELIPQIEVAVDDQVAALVVRHLEPLSEADSERLTGFGRQHGLHIRLQSGGPDSIVPLWPAQQGALEMRNADYDTAFQFEPADFVQVNFDINRAMVKQALELLQVGPQDRVLDLFCGLGNFTLPLARTAASVVGVEFDAGLLQRAATNVEHNGMDNVSFVAADLSQGLPPELDGQHFDKVLIDPPRSGAEAVMTAVAALAPRDIVYVACKPETLARDLAILVGQHGYRLRSAGIMDMFPHTAHIESMAWLTRGDVAAE